MLSKAEILYLQGQKQVSKSFEYKLNHSIRKKVTSFLNNELPLLEENHILDLISIKSLGKAKVAGSIPAQGFLFGTKESQFELLGEHVNGEDILPKSVRSLPKSVRNGIRDQIDWEGNKKYLGKNFTRYTAKARHSYYQILSNSCK